jgi:general stress protein 26
MELKDKILDVTGGVNISAFATVKNEQHPVPRVRYVATVGFPDLSMKIATHKSSTKMSHIKKNPKGGIATWKGKGLEDFGKPYVIIDTKIEILDDEKSKNEFWDPMLEKYFSGPDDPEYVILNLKPYSIEYYSEGKMEKLTSIE